MKTLLRFLVALCLLAPALAPASSDPELDAFIQARMDAIPLPGLAATVVRGPDVVWSGQYGWANLEQGIPAGPETLWMLASVSKVVTAMALMQVWEGQGFSLDQAVNDYLPFTVANPRHPDQAITFRHLLSHVSSIADNYDVLDELYTQGDSPIALEDFLRDYLSPGGRYYDAQGNFSRSAPGQAYDYSNIGFALVGLLAQRLASQPFDAYCQEHIFAPLGMSGQASWFLAGLDQNQVAMPYGPGSRGRDFVPYGHYGFPDYPNGQLRASPLALSALLRALMGQGSWQDIAILTPATMAEMTRVQYPALGPDQGLGLYQSSLGGRRLWGHSGGEQGVAAEMFYENQVGVVLVTNGEPDQSRSGEDAWQEILARLFTKGEQ